MSDEGGSVTLVFYRIGTGIDLFKEPFLNIVAAAFQMSSFTHVEIAIGTLTLEDIPLQSHPCTQYERPPQKADLAHRVFFCAGNEAGSMGQMSNVCRIFNDDVGVRAIPMC